MKKILIGMERKEYLGVKYMAERGEDFKSVKSLCGGSYYILKTVPLLPSGRNRIFALLDGRPAPMVAMNGGRERPTK